MAKSKEELMAIRSHMVINPFTSGDSEHVVSFLTESAWTGEIAIQGKNGDASIWTLAKEGDPLAIEFVSKKAVEGMIVSGAGAEVQVVKDSVGLFEDGSLISGDTSVWGEPKNFSSASTVVDAVKALDSDLFALSGHVESLDKEASAEAGKIVTTVSEENGLVSETKAYLKDVVLSGYTKGAQTGAIADSDTVEQALSKIENSLVAQSLSAADASVIVATGDSTTVKVNIKSGENVIALDATDGIYIDIKLSGVTPSEANVKEEYVLYATDGTVLGDHIKIYKDSALYRVYLGHVDDTVDPSTGAVSSGTGDTALCFIYKKADETYELVAVNVEEFLEESEFSSGLTVDNHVVKVKIADDSEEFLTVTEGGVKLSGVTNAIAEAISGLTASGDDYVNGKFEDGALALSANVITTVNEFSGVSANGKLVDAFVVKSIIVDNEEVTAAALNDLNDRIEALSGSSEGGIEALRHDTEASAHTLSQSIVALSGNVESTIKAVSGNIESTIIALSGDVESAIAEAISGLTASGDDYVNGEFEDGALALSANVITTVNEFSGVSQNGKLVDAFVVKSIIVDNERVTAAALNDLNDKITALSGSSIGDFTALSASTVALSASTVSIESNLNDLSASTVAIESGLNAVSASTVALSADTEAQVARLDGVVGTVNGEYGHTGTTYLDGNSSVKEDVEDLDVALKALSDKLELTGVDNAYMDVTVTTAATGTSIEVSAKTQTISASTAAEQGLADAYDVKQFAVHGVDQTSSATTANVQVVPDGDGERVLDFSHMVIDCGQF